MAEGQKQSLDIEHRREFVEYQVSQRTNADRAYNGGRQGSGGGLNENDPERKER